MKFQSRTEIQVRFFEISYLIFFFTYNVRGRVVYIVVFVTDIILIIIYIDSAAWTFSPAGKQWEW